MDGWVYFGLFKVLCVACYKARILLCGGGGVVGWGWRLVGNMGLGVGCRMRIVVCRGSIAFRWRV